MKKLNMKVTNYMFITVILTIVAACEGKKGAVTENKITVKTITVSQTESINTRHYIGTVEEKSAASLSFQVAGNIMRIHVNEGESVRKGQILATLDRTNLEQTWTAAQAALTQAEDAYQRMKLLHDNNSLPDIKWIEVESKLQQARSIEAIARHNLDETALVAPAAGIIGKRLAEVGENVAAGAPIMTLLDISKIQVKIAVPEHEIGALHTGQSANLKVKALNDAIFTGSISERGVTANPISHTYDTKISLANPESCLLPGMVCQVAVEAEKETGTQHSFALPNNVVLVSHTGDRFVWRVIDGRAKATPVETGALTDNGLLITAGLNEGDRVITDGYQKISENMKVKAE